MHKLLFFLTFYYDFSNPCFLQKNIVYRCKLPISKQRRLRDLFVSGSTARAAARVVGVNRMTGILFFRKLREKIATDRIAEAQKKNRRGERNRRS